MKRLLLLLLFAAPSFGQKVILIQNPSFEQGMSGWVVTPLKAYDGTFGNAQAVAWTGAPDGSHVAYLVNAAISQDLKIAPESGVYLMKVSTANWFYSYPNSLAVSFTIGGKAICTISQVFPLGDFTEMPLTCTIPGYIAIDHAYGYSGNLGISFSTTGAWWGVLLDNVSLTFTPTN